MKKFSGFVISLVLGAAPVAFGANAICESCLATRPNLGEQNLISTLPELASNLDNVASLVNPKLEFPTMAQIQSQQSSYLNIVPNDQAPKTPALPGEFDPASVNPNFISTLWNWQAPSVPQLLPQIYY